jgi:hypothetical protein
MVAVLLADTDGRAATGELLCRDTGPAGHTGTSRHVPLPRPERQPAVENGGWYQTELTAAGSDQSVQ